MWGWHLQHTETLGKVGRIQRGDVLKQPEAKLHKWESMPFRSVHLSPLTVEKTREIILN